MVRRRLPRWVRLRVAGAIGLASSSPALAFHVEVRWVERIGAVDHVIGGDGATVSFAPGTSHRIRIQFGVFDDADGPAPAGGYIGWNTGTLATSGGINTRTPGRLTPFNFAPNPPGNGLPSADPFGTLTAIDNTLGTQSPQWLCDSEGHPLPMPQPVIRGLNAFSSVYEFTTVTGVQGYSISVGGNQLAASAWQAIVMRPPLCEPGNPLPIEQGMLTYAPVTLPPIALAATLNIVVPSPACGVFAIGIGVSLACRRRRTRPAP